MNHWYLSVFLLTNNPQQVLSETWIHQRCMVLSTHRANLAQPKAQKGSMFNTFSLLGLLKLLLTPDRQTGHALLYDCTSITSLALDFGGAPLSCWGCNLEFFCVFTQLYISYLLIFQ